MNWRFVNFCLLTSCLMGGCGLLTVRHVVTATNSMSPTIDIGDHIGASGIKSKELTELKRFDIVLYKRPADPQRGIDEKTFFIHRIIGLPGEKIELRKGVVYVNGQLLDESSFQKIPSEDNYKPVIVRAGEFYVLGDNRPNAEDSRFVGTIKKADIDSIAGTIIRKADYDSGKRW